MRMGPLTARRGAMTLRWINLKRGGVLASLRYVKRITVRTAIPDA
jgi:hypothetical protein